MGTAIVITSGKGGTGKTTTAAALSSFLAARGSRVLCVDCDVGLKNLDLSLGLTDTLVPDFTDVLDGRLSPDAAAAHPQILNLFFLSAPSGLRPEEIDPEAMAAFVRQAKDAFDYCVIDSPAGMGAGFRLALTCADRAIVVTTGDASSLRDGQRVVAELHRLEIPDVRVLVNRVRPRLLRRTCATVDDIIDAVGARLIGIVSEDETVSVAANLETPLFCVSDSRAAAQFRRIAARVDGEELPLGKI